MLPAKIKSILRRILVLAKPIFEWMAEVECKISAAWTKTAHKRLMWVQWVLPPQPENFDHHIDLFYWWQKSGNPQWLERGVYGAIAIKGGNLLELCCGDGFNARNFYSIKSKQLVACDFDPKIIRVAKRKNAAPNISFLVADIRMHMPEGRFDNIAWDAAIEHFTVMEIQDILRGIKARLSSNGILSGYTIVELSAGRKQLSHHEYEFKGKEDLLRLLSPHFKNTTVFETEYPGRHNLYFWASDAAIPFGEGWPNVISNHHDSY